MAEINSGIPLARKISQPELLRPSINYPRIPYGEMLTHALNYYPENVAIIFRDISLTYRELDGLTNSLANALRWLGIQKGDRVCLLMTNRPEYVVSFYALARVGAVASPMNPSYKEREISYQVGNSDAVAIIVQNDMVPLVEAIRHENPQLRHIIAVGPGDPPAKGEVLKFRDLVHQFPGTTPQPVDIEWDDLLALPYSSGTTGLPKGVMLSHKALVCNNLQMVACGRLNQKDRMMLFLPFYHIYGTMLMGGGVYSGATMVIMERFDPVETCRLVQEHGVTLFYAVPPVLIMLSNWPELKNYDFSSVRHIMTGAAPLAPEVGRRFSQLTGVSVIQGYGLTEAAPLTHINIVYDDSLAVLETVGLPAHDTEQKVVDLETGEKELGVGEVGEIIVRGPQIMQGYWKAPEATAVTLRNGWLYTGDIGFIDENGHAVIVDRKKEMIKYKGFGIAPAELEALLFEHPAVADAAVIGKPDDEAGEIPKGFVVLKEGERLTPEELMAWANGKMAGYKTIREIEFLPAIPKTASGKILRRVLKEQEKQKLGLA